MCWEPRFNGCKKKIQVIDSNADMYKPIEIKKKTATKISY